MPKAVPKAVPPPQPPPQPPKRPVDDADPRQVAVEVLTQRLTHREFTEELLDTALSTHRLPSVDRGLCRELVCGVVRWQALLDWLIARKLDPTRNLQPELKVILCLGLYQLFWLDRIPQHAVLHETVKSVKYIRCGPKAGGFINAILRSFQREFDDVKAQLADLKISQPALGWSHPEWLVEKWGQRYDEETLRRLLEWNNTPPKNFARVNSLKFQNQAVPLHSMQNRRLITFRHAGDLLTRWREEDVAYNFVYRDWLEENLVFEMTPPKMLSALPSFQAGWFYVQDPSTLLAPVVLGAQPGETILDLCAAPGGKTTFIAQQMQNTGHIVATDIDGFRMKRVRQNCARLGVGIVTTELISRARFTPCTFDRILIDAPCSNTGVLRRRVDLRWRLQPTLIEHLRVTQLELLNNATPWVKPGGVIVYSTCSLEPEENGDIVQAFLDENPMFNLEMERQLTPFTDGVDGAYVAKLRYEEG